MPDVAMKHKNEKRPRDAEAQAADAHTWQCQVRAWTCQLPNSNSTRMHNSTGKLKQRHKGSFDTERSCHRAGFCVSYTTGVTLCLQHSVMWWEATRWCFNGTWFLLQSSVFIYCMCMCLCACVSSGRDDNLICHTLLAHHVEIVYLQHCIFNTSCSTNAKGFYPLQLSPCCW